MFSPSDFCLNYSSSCSAAICNIYLVTLFPKTKSNCYNIPNLQYFNSNIFKKLSD